MLEPAPNKGSILKRGIGATLLMAAGAAALLVTVDGCTSIDTTEDCFETRYGRVINKHMKPGLTTTITTDVTCFPLTDQNFPAGFDGKETMEAQTKDPITVQGDVAIVWAYDPTTTEAVFTAKRNPQAVQVEVLNAIREGYRSAMAGWTVADIFSEKRPKLADSVKVHIQNKLGNRAIIRTVFVRAITVPKAIEDARTAAAQQAQILDKALKEKAIAEANAATEITRAEGSARANQLRANSYASNPRLLDLDIAQVQATALANVCAKATTCVIGGSVADVFSGKKP